MGSSNPDREPTTGDNPSPPPPPSTFHGRLQLQDFMYQAGDTPGLRRSSRHASSVSASPAVPSSTPSPVKRARSGSTSPSPSKTKKKKKRASSGYAPPSTYAHLSLLPDALLPNLIVLFVGLNPGLRTAITGHAYAHPTNTFWRVLHASGITPRLCAAEEDAHLPALFALGLTNIVARPSRNGGELRRDEMDAGVAVLEDKIREHRPEAVCLVGKGIWESVWRVRHDGRAVGRAFKYGWQEESENMGVVEGEWHGARVFVASSTSGLAATLSPAEKLAIWSELGAWVKMRRAERQVTAERRAAASA